MNTQRVAFPMKIVNAEPWLLTTYRTLRTLGVDRSVSNYLVMGIALGSGAAEVHGGPAILGNGRGPDDRAGMA